MSDGPERVIEAFVADFSQQSGDSDQWVIYRRYDRDQAEAVVAAARLAALRVERLLPDPPKVYIAEVPEDWADAPVRRLPGTAVIRFADHPEPWDARVD
jgi:hypothetical protein